mmetsp:Transcript_33071/g.93601  ORF Transcript_33071/g.93601 Transcript_33071/m.93601 type:complete len:262 (-) Transcript_33071:524-1309(-)
MLQRLARHHLHRLVPQLLELDVSQPHHGRHQLEEGRLFLRIDAHLVHGRLHVAKLGFVVHPIDYAAARGAEVLKVLRVVRQVPRLALLLRGAGHELVEDVIRPLPLALLHHTTLLKEIGANAGPGNGPPVEEYVDQLAKARRVIVPERFGVAEALQDGVGLEDAVLNARAARQPRQVLHHNLGGLRLAGSRLSRYHHRLALPVGHQGGVGGVCHNKGVRFLALLTSVAAAVLCHHVGAVQGQPLVRVDGNEDRAGRGVDVV